MYLTIDEPKYNPMLIEKLLANIFFLFFVAQILSPYVGGRTIYLELIISLINPFFLIWLFKYVNISYKNISVIFLLLCFVVTGHVVTSLKFFCIILEVLFLIYAHSRNIWYIHYYIFISVIFLIGQQVLIVIDPLSAALIGPSNISQSIWGSYATPTFTNFYAVFEFGLPRVSGLSREAGFMASLMTIICIIEYLEYKTLNITIGWFKKVILFIGYIGSFSKMSLLLLPMLLLTKFYSYINKIPVIVIIPVWIVILSCLVVVQKDWLLQPENITYLHRFGAYYDIINLDFFDVIFGTDIKNVNGIFSHDIQVGNLEAYAGFAGWIISNGIIACITYFIALYILRVNCTGVLFLLLATMNVSVDSNQNFVVLAYYAIFRYGIFSRILEVK